ncbi:uncharacterized protein LOC127841683 [Dreissena polymorpha]|uniref:C2H2-type domain-containing protein n=1 Tax=Dreissena polymorpha TaxID=45954 RepID=A0A9D4ERD1_DREPO|nr:uncharacterized protein LOC127841683 [Dreissena polymorpha]XP_052226701.1 uncharacterized protein LOC127841683 [Dreissena polymorpha]KAH3784411.1 hypothetical protein DPMN_162365 [Dreissena polymorpha]
MASTSASDPNGSASDPNGSASDPNRNRKGHPWTCTICGQILSRKQRLQSHIEKKHPAQVHDFDWQVRGPYKRYELDDIAPVPKRTRMRHNPEPQQEQIQPEQDASEGTDEDNILLDCQCESGLLDIMNNEEIDVPSQRDKYMAILSYVNKMKLSVTASEHLVRLLKLLASDKDFEDVSATNIRSIFSEVQPLTIDYCGKCGVPYTTEEEYICQTEGCDELRYMGQIDKQHQKRRKCYFSIVPIAQQLKEILKRDGMLKKIENGNVTLTMNTDGIPLYNSSSVSLWPVLFTINNLPPNERFLTQNLLIWGLWQGSGKPCFKTYLNPLVEELNILSTQGIKLNDVSMKVTLTCITMDLQAKAQVLEMVQHNGEHGCITCEEPGQVYKQGKGHCRGYPLNDTPTTMRTVDTVLSNAEEALNKNSPVKGIKSTSVLFGILYLDLVTACVPDYMHGVLLGTTKKLLSLWMGKANSKEDFYLGNHVKEIDRRLLAMKPVDAFTRLPRRLEGNLSHWKASELQHWLLFYSIPCVHGLLKPRYLDNLCFLVEGIYLLLGDSITEEDLERAELTLAKFQISFQTLYGPQNCGLNIHNIGCHLVQYVRKHGPLWAWSCFGFEDLNGYLIKSSHGTGDVSKQLLSTLFARKQLSAEVDNIKSEDLKAFTSDMLSTGRRIKSLTQCSNCHIAGKTNPVSDDITTRHVGELLNLSTKPNISSAARVQLPNGQIITSRLYSRQQKRVCYAVLTTTGDLAFINKYIHESQTDKCLADISILVVTGFVCKHVSHLLLVKETQDKKLIPVDEILEQVLLIDGNKDLMCVSRLPHFHGLCG